MKTVCDVLGVALFFGSEKKTITRRAGLSPHQAYRRLGVGHPIQDRAAKQSLQVCAWVSALRVLTEWTDTIHMPEATPLIPAWPCVRCIPAISRPNQPEKISVPNSGRTASTLTGMISVNRLIIIAERHSMITRLNERPARMTHHKFANRLGIRRGSFPMMPIEVDFHLMLRREAHQLARFDQRAGLQTGNESVPYPLLDRSQQCRR